MVFIMYGTIMVDDHNVVFLLYSMSDSFVSLGFPHDKGMQVILS